MHDVHLACLTILLGCNPLVPKPYQQDPARRKNYRALAFTWISIIVYQHLKLSPGLASISRSFQDDVHVVLILVAVDAPLTKSQDCALVAYRQGGAAIHLVTFLACHKGNRLPNLAVLRLISKRRSIHRHAKQHGKQGHAWMDGTRKGCCFHGAFPAPGNFGKPYASKGPH